LPASDLSIHRLAKTFDLYLRAAYPDAQAALLGETIYTVLPLAQTRKKEIALQCANGFVTRLRRPSDVVAGIGLFVGDISQLSTSRREADMTLRVLRSREYQDGTPLVANISDVQVESLLLRMADSLKHSNESLSGPLHVLHEHDMIHKSELVATLEAWLNFFGDVAKAANALNIHKNTFRYRLRRVSEIAEVDLSDPAERFGLMLQLRLFS
jgi:DNA-binding PucR family transcriptional regulator